MIRRPFIAITGLAFAAVVGLAGVVAADASDSDSPTRGSIPDSAFDTADGAPDRSQFPDFVPVAGDTSDVGWVASADIFEQADQPEREITSIPVYADDLRTVIGEMVDGVGFVVAGADPGETTVTTVEEPSDAGG